MSRTEVATYPLAANCAAAAARRRSRPEAPPRVASSGARPAAAGGGGEIQHLCNVRYRQSPCQLTLQDEPIPRPPLPTAGYTRQRTETVQARPGSGTRAPERNGSR